MKCQRNVEGLRQNAQKKRLDAIERTEQGIKQLLKEGKAVNFKTVAETAEVSTAWLYGEPEIKERIKNLRKKQNGGKNLPAHQKEVSHKTYKAIVTNLNELINKIETENTMPSDCVKLVEEIALQVSELNQQIDILRDENSRLKEQLRASIVWKEIKQI